jgi:hypothetical protein
MGAAEAEENDRMSLLQTRITMQDLGGDDVQDASVGAVNAKPTADQKAQSKTTSVAKGQVGSMNVAQGATKDTSVKETDRKARAQTLSCRLQDLLVGQTNDLMKAMEASSLKLHGTCAVVSSSGNLFYHQHGHEIDAADVVIRFNDAPVAGFESMVGSKDDLRFINCKMAQDFGRNPSSLGVHTDYIANVDSLLRTKTKLVACHANETGLNPSENMHFVHYHKIEDSLAAFMAHAFEIHSPEGFEQNPNPTSGALGIVTALSMCHEVRAYGFVNGNASSQAPYHYYGTAGDHSLDHASFNVEKELFRQLATNPSDEIDKTEALTMPGFSTTPCQFQAKPLSLLASKETESPIHIQHDKAAVTIRQSLPEGTQTGSQFVIAVPVSVAGFLVACLPLGLLYLAILWSRAGIYERIQTGLEMGWAQKQAAVALAIYLIMLVSTDLVVKREAETNNGHYATSPAIIVPAVEFVKLCTSLCLCAAGSRDGSTQSPSGGSSGAWKVALSMLPVATIYVLNNFLVLTVLASIKMDAFAVWRNISILFNALLWVWSFQKQLPSNRWIAVVICMMACCMNSLQLDGHIALDRAVALVVLSAFLSSIATVLNEFVIKTRASTQLGLDQVNAILYGSTLGLMFLAAAVTAIFQMFRGNSAAIYEAIDRYGTITSGGVKIILMQGLLGLSVSRVLRYADSVAKTVVGSLRDVVLVFIAPLFIHDTRFDWVTIGSVAWVALSGIMYFTPVKEPEEQCAASMKATDKAASMNSKREPEDLGAATMILKTKALPA